MNNNMYTMNNSKTMYMTNAKRDNAGMKDIMHVTYTTENNGKARVKHDMI